MFEAKELAAIEPGALVFLKTETVLRAKFVAAKSDLPSPSTSQMATPYGFDPVVKSTFEAKELAPMVPPPGNVTLKGAWE
jgi:hypothetical protein